MFHAFMDAVSRSPLYGRFIRARPEAGVALWTALQPSYTVLLAHDLEVRIPCAQWNIVLRLTSRLKPGPTFDRLTHLHFLFDTLAMTVAHLPERTLIISMEDDIRPLDQFKQKCQVALRRTHPVPSPDHWEELEWMHDCSRTLIDILASHAGISFGRPFSILAVPFKTCQVGVRLQDWKGCTGMAGEYRSASLHLICSRVSISACPALPASPSLTGLPASAARSPTAPRVGHSLLTGNHQG